MNCMDDSRTIQLYIPQFNCDSRRGFLKIDSVVCSGRLTAIVDAVYPDIERWEEEEDCCLSVYGEISCLQTARFRSYRRGGMRPFLKRTNNRSLDRWNPIVSITTSARRHTHAQKKNESVASGAAFRRTMLNRAINSIRLVGPRAPL